MFFVATWAQYRSVVYCLRLKSSNVVQFCNQRSTAEQWINEGKYALNWALLGLRTSFSSPSAARRGAMFKDLGAVGQQAVMPPVVRALADLMLVAELDDGDPALEVLQDNGVFFLGCPLTSFHRLLRQSDFEI